ncbi:MAG: hypothetical protein WAV20_17225 [Blastocatellia bacterium]
MTYSNNKRDHLIFESLKLCAPSTEQLGYGRWSFELVNGKSFVATARAAEQWLLLDVPVTDRIGRGEVWDLLRMNAALYGLSKVVLMPDNRSVHVRADLPLPADEDADRESERDGELTTRLREACAGLKVALSSFGSAKKQPKALGTVQSAPEAGNRGETLRRAVAETGWRFNERSSGMLIVDLDTRAGFYQATVEHRSAGAAAHVSVEVARFETLGEIPRQALGALLLKTGGLLRLARPAVEQHETSVTARFEVSFGPQPTAVELTHALSALSIACTLCGREARAIQGEAVAREYMSIAAVERVEAREHVMFTTAD